MLPAASTSEASRFKANVHQYLDLDERIRAMQAEMKILRSAKDMVTEAIKAYMLECDLTCVNVAGSSSQIRCVTRTSKVSPKKEDILQRLEQELDCSGPQARELMEKLMSPVTTNDRTAISKRTTATRRRDGADQ